MNNLAKCKQSVLMSELNHIYWKNIFYGRQFLYSGYVLTPAVVIGDKQLEQHQ